MLSESCEALARTSEIGGTLTLDITDLKRSENISLRSHGQSVIHPQSRRSEEKM